ncbi:hypothetical protein [Aureimonas ureilytica]|nr:hypothetical protein [Aureimonas ureilytica]
MAAIANDGCAPAPSSQFALPSEISPILQAATTTLVALMASGGDVRVSGFATRHPKIVCRWDEGAEITYSFMTRTEAERILAEQAAEEIDVILDAEAIRLRDL